MKTTKINVKKNIDLSEIYHDGTIMEFLISNWIKAEYIDENVRNNAIEFQQNSQCCFFKKSLH
jgi:hypothetical protein